MNAVFVTLFGCGYAALGSETNGTSLRRLFLHKWLQARILRQSALDSRKFMRQLALGQIGFLKLVPFVDPTDARY